MKYLLLVFCILFILTDTLNSQSQEVLKYSKLKINLIGRDIRTLAKAGLETDHGNYVKNRYFINDFSISEIKVIQDLGFEFEVLIEDVTAYYSDANRSSELDHTSLHFKGNCAEDLVNEYPYKTPENYRAGSMGGYFTYQELKNILDSMALKYPNLITVRKNIEGIKTHEGNDIFYVKVSDNPNQEESTDPKVLYTALHHAREPNSLSQMIFYLWYLLENYQSEDDVTKIINETQLYFVPCVNPDGYLHNQSLSPVGGGLWRKNKWKNAMGELKGVDLNRNYGFEWGYDNSGSSTNENSSTFRGNAAFSEPETQAMRKLCLDNDFKIALNYHTYGNYLIHPWGFNDALTAEDSLFKAMGNIMNKENQFFMGTGTETVGYVVNGDSDDWMYGEEVEKSKIYAYTPEVGPSFWPPMVDIEYLNSSSMWLNLSTALLTLNYYGAEEKDGETYLSDEFKKIKIRVTRAGLKNGSAVVHLKSLTNGVNVVNESRQITLNHGSFQDLDYDLVVDNQKDYSDGIHFVLEINNDGFIKEEIISKRWLKRSLISIFKDDLKNGNQFVTNSWTLTDQSFVSGPSSMTDSKIGNYKPNQTTEIKLKDALDLSNVKNAFLQFYAKWDVEADYDYVQVLASKDNVDFIPLCGKHSKLGSVFQAFNTPVFDGVQKEWVKEVMDLQGFLGSPKVWLKFVLTSDEFQEGDGFYFDDLEVKALVKSSSTFEPRDSKISIYPSLISQLSTCKITGMEVGATSSLVIRDIMGKIVYRPNLNSNSFEINPYLFSNGAYFVEIWINGVKTSVNKLMILK